MSPDQDQLVTVYLAALKKAGRSIRSRARKMTKHIRDGRDFDLDKLISEVM